MEDYDIPVCDDRDNEAECPECGTVVFFLFNPIIPLKCPQCGYIWSEEPKE